MRDPARIDRICDLLKELWKKNPDLRLGQLLEGMSIFPATMMNGMGMMVPFFQEDDETETRIKYYLK
jgi:hypothetical protein